MHLSDVKNLDWTFDRVSDARIVRPTTPTVSFSIVCFLTIGEASIHHL